jgi:hypothetical protein
LSLTAQASFGKKLGRINRDGQDKRKAYKAEKEALSFLIRNPKSKIQN